MCLLDQTELQTASPRRAALSPLSPAALSLSSQSGSCVWIGQRYWRSVPCSRRIRSWCPENRAADVKATSTHSFSWILGVMNTCVKQSYLCGLLGALVEEVEGARSLHSEQNNQTMSMNHWKLITLINQYIHTGLRSTECDYAFLLVTLVHLIFSMQNVKKYSRYGNFLLHVLRFKPR